MKKVLGVRCYVSGVRSGTWHIASPASPAPSAVDCFLGVFCICRGKIIRWCQFEAEAKASIPRDIESSGEGWRVVSPFRPKTSLTSGRGSGRGDLSGFVSADKF